MRISFTRCLKHDKKFPNLVAFSQHVSYETTEFEVCITFLLQNLISVSNFTIWPKYFDLQYEQEYNSCKKLCNLDTHWTPKRDESIYKWILYRCHIYWM